MDWLQVILLSVVQGLTEFLPISSSAHLILVPVLTDWDDQGLAFDVALHIGSLSAVVLYFRHELSRMTASWVGSLRGGGIDEDARLGWWVLLATLPVCLIGFAFRDIIEVGMRSPVIIGLSLIGFGLVLGYGKPAQVRCAGATVARAHGSVRRPRGPTGEQRRVGQV